MYKTVLVICVAFLILNAKSNDSIISYNGQFNISSKTPLVYKIFSNSYLEYEILVLNGSYVNVFVTRSSFIIEGSISEYYKDMSCIGQKDCKFEKKLIILPQEVTDAVISVETRDLANVTIHVYIESDKSNLNTFDFVFIRTVLIIIGVIVVIGAISMSIYYVKERNRLRAEV